MNPSKYRAALRRLWVARGLAAPPEPQPEEDTVLEPPAPAAATLLSSACGIGEHDACDQPNCDCGCHARPPSGPAAARAEPPAAHQDIDCAECRRTFRVERETAYAPPAICPDCWGRDHGTAYPWVEIPVGPAGEAAGAARRTLARLGHARPAGPAADPEPATPAADPEPATPAAAAPAARLREWLREWVRCDRAVRETTELRDAAEAVVRKLTDPGEGGVPVHGPLLVDGLVFTFDRDTMRLQAAEVQRLD